MDHRYPQLPAYRSILPKVPTISMDFSALEDRTVATLIHKSRGKSFAAVAQQQFKDAVYYGNAFHRYAFEDISTMPRQLFSFHPARNNQIVRTTVQTTADLQEALDLNPDFTHISVVNDGKHWLIHKGPVTGRSATQHGQWKAISLKRLPKPLRTRLLIEPLGE